MMKFDPEYIDTLIDSVHFDAMINRGYEVFSRGSVLTYSIINEELVTFKVRGTHVYDVVLFYKNPKSIKHFRCNCPYNGRCKHQIAVLFYIEHLDCELLNEKDINFTIKLGYTGRYRLLPFKKPKDLRKSIYFLQPKRVNEYYHHLEYTFNYLNQKTINVFAQNITWDQKVKDDFSVDIQLHDKGLQIKCNTCNDHIKTLCFHQYLGLEKLKELKIFDQFLKRELDYEKITQDFCEQEGLPKESLSKLFSIAFDQNEFFIIKINDMFLDSAEIKEQALQLTRTFTNELATEEQIFGSAELNEEFQNGFWWQYDERKGFPLMPIPIEGKINKAQTFLKSNITAVDTPTYFDRDQNELLSQLTYISQKYCSYPFKYLCSEMIKFLKDNLNTLASGIHFYGSENEAVMETYPRMKLRKSALHLISFKGKQLDINFTLSESDLGETFYDLSADIRIGKQLLESNDIKIIHPLFLVTKSQGAILYNNEVDYSILLKFAYRRIITFLKKDLDTLMPLMNNIKLFYHLNVNLEEPPQTKRLTNGKKQIYFSEIGNKIIIKPYILYEKTYKQNAKTGLIENQVDGVFFETDAEEYESLNEFMKSAHFIFKNDSQSLDFYTLSVKDMIANNWFLNFFANCKEENIEVFGTDLLKNFRFNTNRPNFSTIIKSGIDWFDTEMQLTFGELHVPLKSWVDMIRANEKFVKLSDGTFGIIPDEWLDKLRAIYGIGQIEQENIKISKHHFQIVDDLFSEELDDIVSQEIREKQQALKSFDKIEDYQLPDTITATLRSYQIYGYRWLRFLVQYGFGGCLADDMGLGKTLQMICLMAYQKSQGEIYNLIVVPNSLIFNWAQEIDKFCPSISYLIHHGPNRHINAIREKNYDLVITTYGTAVSDIDELKEVYFNYIVLDESQAIKNPSSKRYKSLKLLKADNRFVMTGTPIENSTFDLFAQMNFVNPGLLGNANQFRTKFALPIDKEKEEQPAELLKQMIHPYLLRRTKEQVAPDLPEKSETLIYCEMGRKQQKYYDSVKNDIKNALMLKVDKKGFKKASFDFLQGLLRLRQICNSPLLVDKSARAESVKIDVLMDQLMNNNANKTLIFSQFTTMLKLICRELDKQRIKYAYLDGTTKDRELEVKKFQNDERYRVFLISIKAGNTGLNLTEADYVYIIDPWWNPAVEAQAIDRTHRIGQHKKVFAYKLVCKNTIEDKILQLQDKKKKIADDIIQMDTNIFKDLKKEDMLSFFE